MNLMIFLGDQEQIPWSAMEYVIGQVSPKANVACRLNDEPSSSLALIIGQLVQVLLIRSSGMADHKLAAGTCPGALSFTIDWRGPLPCNQHLVIQLVSNMFWFADQLWRPCDRRSGPALPDERPAQVHHP